MLDRRWLRWVLILIAWTLLALFFATQNYINAYVASQYRNRPLTFRLATTLALSEWYLWAAIAPGIVWLARRFAIEGPRKWRSVLVHLVAAAVVSVVKFAADGAIIGMLGFNPPAVMTIRVHPNFLTYWVIVGATRGLDYYRRYREREALLAKAQLETLRMQLQPHFLFNTLHAISTLMHRDVEAADRVMARLSGLLRQSLDTANLQAVALRREIEFVEGYLDIQKVRFSDRLRVEMDIDPEALDALLPNFLLQPLVENAVRHGIGASAAAATIAIRARRDNGSLRIEIEDDGPGISGEIREGVGLSNTRARLRQLYGASHQLELSKAPRGGLLVRLHIPFAV